MKFVKIDGAICTVALLLPRPCIISTYSRKELTDSQRLEIRKNDSIRKKNERENENKEENANRLDKQILRQRKLRDSELEEGEKSRKEKDAAYHYR
jgi:hypothetical protein